MEKELRALLLSFIGRTLNKSAEEVSSLLFTKGADDAEVLQPNALDGLLSLDKTRIQALENENKNHYDKGFNKAKAETLSKFEKDIKEKFGITEDKQGLELIDSIIASKVTGSELEEEKVKRSKTYLDAIDALKKEKEAVAKEWENKFNSREKQLEKEATLKSVSEKALSFVKSLNPILPADEKKAQNQLQTLVDKLNTYEYEVKEDGKIVVLKKEGDEFKVLVDEHKHPVSFEDMVKQHASSYWDFKEGQHRQGTGNNNDDNDGGGAGKGYSGPKPKNEEEYQKLISEAKDDDARIAITKAWTGTK